MEESGGVSKDVVGKESAGQHREGGWVAVVWCSRGGGGSSSGSMGKV